MFTSVKLPVKTAIALAKLLERETEQDFSELTQDRAVSFEFLREFNELRLSMLDYWRCVFE